MAEPTHGEIVARVSVVEREVAVLNEKVENNAKYAESIDTTLTGLSGTVTVMHSDLATVKGGIGVIKWVVPILLTLGLGY